MAAIVTLWFRLLSWYADSKPGASAENSRPRFLMRLRCAPPILRCATSAVRTYCSPSEAQEISEISVMRFHILTLLLLHCVNIIVILGVISYLFRLLCLKLQKKKSVHTIFEIFFYWTVHSVHRSYCCKLTFLPAFTLTECEFLDLVLFLSKVSVNSSKYAVRIEYIFPGLFLQWGQITSRLWEESQNHEGGFAV